MNQLIAIINLLLVATLVAPAMPPDLQRKPQKIVVEYVVQQAALFEAVKATKTESDLVVLNQTVEKSSKTMVNLAKQLEALGPFDEQTSRTLWSLKATKEYEIIGAALMVDALRDAPSDLRPKIMKVFEGKIRQLQTAEEQLNKSIKKKNLGPEIGRASVPIEAEFVALVSTIHQKDPITDPAIGISFSVQVNQDDGSSIVLYDQVIPWNEKVPSNEELSKWISYARDDRVITFTYPGGEFTHQLPKKR